MEPCDLKDVFLDNRAHHELEKLSREQTEDLARRLSAKNPSNPSAFVMAHVKIILQRSDEVSMQEPERQRTPSPPGAGTAAQRAVLECNAWRKYQDGQGRMWWCNEAGAPDDFFIEGDPAWCMYNDGGGRFWWHHSASGRWFYTEEPSAEATSRQSCLRGAGVPEMHNNDEAYRHWQRHQDRWPEMLVLLVQRMHQSMPGLIDTKCLGQDQLLQHVADSVPCDDLSFLVRALASPSGAGLRRQWGQASGGNRPVETQPPLALLRFVCSALAAEPGRFSRLFTQTSWRPFQGLVLDLAADLAEGRGRGATAAAPSPAAAGATTAFPVAAPVARARAPPEVTGAAGSEESTRSRVVGADGACPPEAAEAKQGKDDAAGERELLEKAVGNPTQCRRRAQLERAAWLMEEIEGVALERERLEAHEAVLRRELRAALAELQSVARQEAQAPSVL